VVDLNTSLSVFSLLKSILRVQACFYGATFKYLRERSHNQTDAPLGIIIVLNSLFHHDQVSFQNLSDP